jgi:hypothetical protein
MLAARAAVVAVALFARAARDRLLRAAAIDASSSSSGSSTTMTMAMLAMGDAMLAAASIPTSVALVLRTRRVEVDGPIPPHSSSSMLDGVVVLVTGAK